MMHPRLEAARYRLLRGAGDDDRLSRPFLAAAAFSLVPAGHRDEVADLAVDREWRLYWNASWVESAPIEDVTTVLCRQLIHLMGDHSRRLEPWPHEVGVLAATLEANSRLREEGFPLPEGSVLPEEVGLPDGLIAEEYAALLSQRADPREGRADDSEQGRADDSGKGRSDDSEQGREDGSGESRSEPSSSRSESSSDRSESPSARSKSPSARSRGGRLPPTNGSGATGHRQPWELGPDEAPGLSRAEADAVRRAVAEAIRIAASSRDRGDVPGWWRRWAEEVLEPRVDWRRELASLVRRAVDRARGQTHHAYHRPSRRQGVVRPGDPLHPARYSPRPRVAVVVDTSGSVSDSQLAFAVAEVLGIVRAIHRDVMVLACDAAVHAVQRVTATADLHLAGGGGTDMRVGLQAALELRPRPDLVVVLTDGETPWPDAAPDIPVVVALHGRGEAPGWAHVVRVEV